MSRRGPKAKLARRVQRLEDRHRRDVTRLHNEIAQLRVAMPQADPIDDLITNLLHRDVENELAAE